MRFANFCYVRLSLYVSCAARPCPSAMNFLDTYDVTGSITPPASGQPQQSLNEEVTQVIGQLGRFLGGVRKQVSCLHMAIVFQRDESITFFSCRAKLFLIVHGRISAML
jgi:hypothetical protein